MKMKLAILGGDQRQVYMARQLADRGHQTYIWGLGACEEEVGQAVVCNGWETAVNASEAVILPMPVSSDGVRVHCPLLSEDRFLRIPALLDALDGRLLLGGRFSEALRGIAESRGVRWIDYYESEVLKLRNALPTAEGAIAIAMKELPVTLGGSATAVIGYGRIGSLLADKLRDLGMQVTVFARRSEQLTDAVLHRHSVYKMTCKNRSRLAEAIPANCRVLFNTVPYRLFSKEQLERLPRGCVLIDLASAPGGIDHTAAAQLGIKSIWATALPGRHTPESAGVIIADVIEEILSELD